MSNLFHPRPDPLTLGGADAKHRAAGRPDMVMLLMLISAAGSAVLIVLVAPAPWMRLLASVPLASLGLGVWWLMRPLERRSTQAAWSANERRFQAMVENSSEAVSLVNAEGVIVYVTPSVTRVLGYTPEDYVGRNAFSLLHPDDLDYGAALFAQLVEAPHARLAAEIRYRHHDQHWVWLEVVGTNLLAEPSVQGIVVNFRDMTTRKQADDDIQNLNADLERRVQERTAELWESEKRFRILFESSPDAIMLIDPHSTEAVWAIVDCNTVACQMNGYPRESLIGQSIDMLHLQPAILQERQAYWDRLRQLGHMTLETYHRHQAGHLFPIEVSTSLIQLAGQEIVLGIDRDITERKHAEEVLAARTAELEETARFLETVLETTPVGLFMKEAEGLRFVRWNRANEAIIGLTAAEVLGKNDYDFFPKAEADFFVAIDRGVLANAEVLDIPEEQVHTSHAGIRTLHTRKVRLLGRDGQPKYMLGVSEDITERIRAEAELKQAAAATEAASAILRGLNATPDVTEAFPAVVIGLRTITACEHVSLILLDESREGGTVTALDQPRVTLGVGTPVRLTEAIADMDLQMGRLHLTPDLLAERAQPVAQALLAAGYRGRVTLPLRLDGQVMGALNLAWRAPVEASEVPLPLLSQIADAVALAMERSRLFAETERRAAELETSNRELEAFSYSVSHDLRAPLRSIDGFSRLVLREAGEGLNAEGQRNLGKVISAGERMTQLIDDLLHLSRVTRAEVRHEPVDLSTTVRDLLTDLHSHQPERLTDLIIADELIASGDERLLRVALENLLSNAWKFTGRQAVTRIEFGATLQAQRPIYFVRDNGAGFDMAYAHKLFGAFQRLHTEDEFPGTGIGLAIVQRIIQRHGGRVWADGAPGQGATFFFTLP